MHFFFPLFINFFSFVNYLICFIFNTSSCIFSTFLQLTFHMFSFFFQIFPFFFHIILYIFNFIFCFIFGRPKPILYPLEESFTLFLDVFSRFLNFLTNIFSRVFNFLFDIYIFLVNMSRSIFNIML